VQTIYQEFNLVPHLTVMENICLGSEPSRFWGVLRDVRAMARRSEETLSRLGIHIDVRRRVSELGVAEQQLVEIAKALHFSAAPRLLILDEPTAALSLRETERLFDTVRVLVEEGIAVLYITHRFEELAEIGDRITVMRDGAVVATRPLQGLQRNEIVQLMVGEDVEPWTRSASTAGRQWSAGDVALEVRGGRRADAFDDIDLTLHWGEVVGIFGLIGAGRTELVRALIGADRFDAGEVHIRGMLTHIPNTTVATRLGIGVSPEDRKGQGIIPGQSVLENITLRSLGALTRWGMVISPQRARTLAADFVERLRIKTPGLDAKVGKLSGGNQQKVVLARLLCAGVQILLFDEPTRGIDVAAKREVYALIRELSEAGNAVLVVTSELDEALSVPDRLFVMREGSFSGEVDPAATTREAVLQLAFPHLDADVAVSDDGT
jgi:ribose transport system ATP-binding protein